MAPLERRATPLATLWPATGLLAVILVVAKAASGTAAWFPDVPVRLLAVLASSWADVFFALVCGAIGEITLRMLARSRRGTAIAWTLFYTIFAIFAAYAVAAVGLFRYFNRPLTYDLLGLVGNAVTVRSSIAERIATPVAIGLIAAPISVLAGAFLFRRSQRSRLIVPILAGAWIAAGWSLQRVGWQKEHQPDHLWLSPHAEFLRTSAVRLAGGQRPSFPKDFPSDFTREFRSFGARAVLPSSRFPPPQGVARPRNVIIVVLESVGTKYLGLYGATEDITPNLTAESANALVFENIYAHASFSYASFRPINFSVYPGLPWHYALLQDARPLPKTLASVMRDRGARTGYFTSGDLDWGDQRWLLERGGDFQLLIGAADLPCPLVSTWGAEDRCAFDRLVQWVDQQPNEPFFAICWTDQTHDPFLLTPGVSALSSTTASEQPNVASDLARYRTNLHQVDAQLGRLFAALRERGLADDTLVVVTGDHGEAFADPHQQRGHAWSVYEEEVRVPLLLWNPGLFPGAQRQATIGGHVDMNPTIADVLDVPVPNEWQGHSLFDAAHPERAYFMAIAGGDVFGVREGNWKYIYDVTSGRESLFDLATDPREQQDTAAPHPELCLELRRRLAAWVTFEDAYLWGRAD